MQTMKNAVLENVHLENVRALLDKFTSAEAILVGAAAGMSASCGFNFFYQNDERFQKYLGDFHKKMEEYQNFVRKYHGKKLVILELGVGWRNRMIKEPFMNLAAPETEAVYITFNKGEVYIPSEIAGKSIGVDGDIGEALRKIGRMV